MSCACEDVSNFKHSDVKMLLLNPWSECKNLVKKLQAILNI